MPCCGYLPNTLRLPSLSSLTLSSSCNNRPVSRASSSSDPVPAQTHSTSCCCSALLACSAGSPQNTPPLCAPAICTLVLLCHAGCSASCHISPPILGAYWTVQSPVRYFFRCLYAFCPVSPVHKDLFYSLQRPAQHWSNVLILHAAPEISIFSIQFHFSYYLSFLNLSSPSPSIFCSCCRLSITITQGQSCNSLHAFST